MAIERKDRSIILTGETAKNFNYKMKSLDPSVIIYSVWNRGW